VILFADEELKNHISGFGWHIVDPNVETGQALVYSYLIDPSGITADSKFEPDVVEPIDKDKPLDTRSNVRDAYLARIPIGGLWNFAAKYEFV